MTDLVERLEAAIASFPGTKWYGGYHPGPNVPRALLVEAAAALRDSRSNTLEEAAKVAEIYRQQYLGPTHDADYGKGFCRGAETACENIAVAIRALKGDDH